MYHVKPSFFVTYNITPPPPEPLSPNPNHHTIPPPTPTAPPESEAPEAPTPKPEAPPTTTTTTTARTTTTNSDPTSKRATTPPTARPPRSEPPPEPPDLYKSKNKTRKNGSRVSPSHSPHKISPPIDHFPQYPTLKTLLKLSKTLKQTHLNPNSFLIVIGVREKSSKKD